MIFVAAALTGGYLALKGKKAVTPVDAKGYEAPTPTEPFGALAPPPKANQTTTAQAAPKPASIVNPLAALGQKIVPPSIGQAMSAVTSVSMNAQAGIISACGKGATAVGTAMMAAPTPQTVAAGLALKYGGPAACEGTVLSTKTSVSGQLTATKQLFTGSPIQSAKTMVTSQVAAIKQVDASVKKAADKIVSGVVKEAPGYILNKVGLGSAASQYTAAVSKVTAVVNVPKAYVGAVTSKVTAPIKAVTGPVVDKAKAAAQAAAKAAADKAAAAAKKIALDKAARAAAAAKTAAANAAKKVASATLGKIGISVGGNSGTTSTCPKMQTNSAPIYAWGCKLAPATLRQAYNYQKLPMPADLRSGNYSATRHGELVRALKPGPVPSGAEWNKTSNK
jgi:hypothetical protein